MTSSEFIRLDQAAKMIEADAAGAYYTVRSRFGADVAGALLILYLRIQHNPQGQWPAPDNVIENVEKILRKEGILNES